MKLCIHRILGALIVATPWAAYADQMHWVDRGNNTVQFANRDGTNRGSFAIGTSGNGVAVDRVNGHVYWSEEGPDKVRRANLDGTDAIDILTSTDAIALALDEYGGKIYWTTDDFGLNSSHIKRANLNGTGVENVLTISTGGIAFASGLALDLLAGKVYWTEFLTQKVRRANLDGTGVQDVILSGGNVTEITLDLTNGKMYWGACNSSGLGLRRANLDGTSPETVRPNPSGTLCFNGVDLDAVEGKVYWTEPGTHSVQRSNLDGTSSETLVSSGLVSGEHIALDTQSALPPGVPTVSTWGLVALSLLVMIAGVCLVRERNLAAFHA